MTGLVSESSVAPVRYDCQKFPHSFFYCTGLVKRPWSGDSVSPHLTLFEELAPSVTQVSYPLTSNDKLELLSCGDVMYASDDSDSDTHFTS